MMKMLKLLRLMVFVACIAAFASGCGGGGGSATMPDPEPPAMPEPTEPTDAERITAAREILATILTDAGNLALAASSAAAAVQFHTDATAEQVASALAEAGAAQAALTLIEGIVSGAANPAITLAQAQMAVTDAQAALANLTAAQSAAASIQSAVETVASQRQQMQADVAALTNNSSLIQHVRANKLLSDAVLGAAALITGTTNTDGSIFVDAAGNSGPSSADPRVACAPPCAEFPANIGTGETAVVGQRTVRVGTLVSNSTTPTLTGTGRLPYGFNLDNGTATTDPTVFINAYTDIAPEGRVRNTTAADDPDTLHDDRYDYKPDTDYLVAGIWLTVDATFSASRITAFAYGGQPLTAAPDFCTTVEGSGTVVVSTTNRTCTNPAATGFQHYRRIR